LGNHIEQQKVLPGFEKIIPEELQRFPQPHEDTDILKWYEILYHPLDLKFRGRLHKWLNVFLEKRKFKLKELLDNYHFKIVSLYLFPQPPRNRWLSQGSVMKKLVGNSKKRLKKPLTDSMVTIWRKVHTIK